MIYIDANVGRKVKIFIKNPGVKVASKPSDFKKWLHDRLQKELGDKGDKSLRHIGRIVAEEAGTALGVQISPATVRLKARQIEKSQEAQESVARKKKPAPQASLSEVIVKEIDKRVKRKQSIAQAAEAISVQFNKSPAAIRKIYRVEKEKSAYQPTASQPMHFAEIAILQLGRISKKDKGWNEALQIVETWIEKFRSEK